MMTENTETGRSMLRYLLDEMPHAERVDFEDQYLKDTGVFHELVELETDLLDLYALGELSEGDRKRLERSFLADPARRQRLALAKSLNSYSASPSGSDAGQLAHESRQPVGWQLPSAMQLAAAVLLVLALPLIVWLFITNRRLSHDVEALRHEQANVVARAQALENQIAALNQKLENGEAGQGQLAQNLPQARGVVSFTLQTDVSRGNSEAPKLVVPSAAHVVLLHLLFPRDSFAGYNLTLETADGMPTWRQQNIQSRVVGDGSEQLSVEIPADLFKPRDYVLQVAAKSDRGMEDVAAYSFHVIRR
jgi:hypothetical protein